MFDIKLCGVTFFVVRGRYYVKSNVTSYGLIPVSLNTFTRFYNRQFQNTQETLYEISTVS